MSVSTNAILFYGYCWDDEAEHPWPDGEGEVLDEDEDDNWEDRYARARGCLPPDAEASAREHKKYETAKKKLVAASRCRVDTHCMTSCPMPYVAVEASVTISHRGYPSTVTSIDVDPTWDEALTEFCKTLGIKVGKKKPSWWLVSDWSE